MKVPQRWHARLVLFLFAASFGGIVPRSLAGLDVRAAAQLDRDIELIPQYVPYAARIAIDPSGAYLATSYHDLTLYSLSARVLLHSVSIRSEEHPYRSLDDFAFVAGGRWLLVEHSDGWMLYDPRSDEVSGQISRWRSRGGGVHYDAFSIAGNAPRGVALVRDGEEETTTVVGLDVAAAPGRHVTLDTTWRGSVPEVCEQGAVSDGGGAVVVRCKESVAVFTGSNPTPHRVELPQAARTAPREGRSVWVTEDGRHVLVLSKTKGWEKHLLHWIDVSARTVKMASDAKGESPAIVTSVLGLFGPDPFALVVTDDETILRVEPAGESRALGRVPPGVGAVAYEAHNRIFVGAEHGLSLFAADGTVLGRIASTPATIEAMAVDPNGRTYVHLHAETVRDISEPATFEVDFAEGELRPARSSSTEMPPPALIADVSPDRGEFSDFRNLEERRPLPMVKDGVSLDRLQDRWLFVQSPQDLRLIDLADGSVRAVLPRPGRDDPATLGLVLPNEDAALLLARSGEITRWSLPGGKREARWESRWRFRKGRPAPIRSLVALPSGLVLAAGAAGLFRSKDPSEVEFAPLAEEATEIDVLRVSPDGRRLALGMSAGLSLVCTLQAGDETIGECVRIAGSDPRFVDGGKRVLVTRPLLGVSLVDAATGEPVVDVYATNDGGSLFATPEGFYKATPSALSLATLVSAGRAWPLERLDLELNRPSRVLAAIGYAAPERVQAYRRLEERRARRYGRDAADVPENAGQPRVRPRITLRTVPPIYTDAPTLEIPFTVKAETPGPVTVHVRNNDRPVYGSRGHRLEVTERGVDDTVGIPLAAGENHVTFTAVDSKGAHALGEHFVTTLTGDPTPGRVRYLGVAVSALAGGKAPLELPAKDVEDVRRALTSLLGDRLEARVLLEEEATRAGIAKARDFLDGAGPEDTVLVYLAGHGVLDDRGAFYFAAHGTSPSNPAQRGVSIADLEDLVDGLSAASVVIFIDSCHAGEDELGDWSPFRYAEPRVRKRGTRVVDESPVPGSDNVPSLNRVFADLRGGTGATIIAASSKRELAWEEESLANGLFTHAVLESLQKGSGANEEGELRIPDLVQAIRALVIDLTGGQQRPNVLIGDVRNARPLVQAPRRKVIRAASTASRPVRAFALSGNQRVLALVFDDGLIVLDPTGVQQPRRLPHLPSAANADVACKARCRVLVSDGGDRLVLKGDDEIEVLDLTANGQGYRGPAPKRCLTLAADGRHLLESGGPGPGALVHLERSLEPHPLGAGLPCAAAFDPRKSTFVAGEWGRAIRVDADTASTEAIALSPVDAPIVSATIAGAVSRRGRYLLGGRMPIDGSAGRVALWSLEDGALIFSQETPSEAGVIVLTDDGPVGIDGESSGMGGSVRVLSREGRMLAEVPALLSGARRILENGKLLQRGDQLLLTSEGLGATPKFVVDEATRIRVLDAKTGAASGFFQVSGARPVLLQGDKDTLYVLETSTGQVERIEHPQ